jgi:hypothetical protein
VEPAETKPATPPVVTFKAMTERYLLEKEAAKKRTLEYDRYIINKLVAHFGADTPVTEITAPRIAAFRIYRLTLKSERTKRSLAPASVNRELAVLRAVLRLAADEECGFLEKAPRVGASRSLTLPDGGGGDDAASRVPEVGRPSGIAAPKRPSLPRGRDRAEHRDAPRRDPGA